MAAGLTGKTAPAGWIEIKANSNKHEDCSQVGKSGSCHIVDDAFAMKRLQLEWMAAVLRSYIATELLRMLVNDGFKAFSRGLLSQLEQA